MAFRKRVLKLALLLGVALLSSCRAERSSPQSLSADTSLRPLNVVVVTIDTLRPDHLHCYGYQKIETPVVDGLAQRGALFENAVAQAPLTPPSHASIFTGQYPTVHHVRNTGGFVLPSSARPLAKILQEKGWDTAAFVSSAVLKKVVGFNNGFAVYDDQMPRQGDKHEFGEESERPAGDTVNRAVQWLATQSGKPYFLWVHLYDPHMPYKPPSPFKEKYKGSSYDGEIAYTDQLDGLCEPRGRSNCGQLRSTAPELPGDTAEQMNVITRKRCFAAYMAEPLVQLFCCELPHPLDVHPNFSVHSSVSFLSATDSMDALSGRKGKLVRSVSTAIGNVHPERILPWPRVYTLVRVHPLR